MKKLLVSFCFFWVLCQQTQAQIEPTLRFTRYGIENGLSQITAKVLLEDKVDGHVWIGTQDGLNRFDGYQFKIFKHLDEDSTSLGSNRINAIYQDSEGRIWIGTSAGLDLYDRQKESFVHFKSDLTDSNSLSHPNVLSIVQYQVGGLWIGTENGLNYLDLEKKQFSRYNADSTANMALISNKIFSLLCDNNGVLWVGTDNGLNRYERKAKTFQKFYHDPKNQKSISGNEITTMFQDAQERLWIGTTTGLNLFNSETNEFRRFVQKSSANISLTDNDVRALCQDGENRIWIGTRWGGINILDTQTNQLRVVQNEQNNLNSLSNNTVLSLIRDRRDNMWVGVSGMGFNVYNPRTSRFKHFKHKANDENSLPDDEVWSILKDRVGQTWVATYAGISVISKSGDIRHIKNDPQNPTSLSSNQVTTLYQDREDRIWVGTIYGLNLYRPTDNSFIHYRNQKGDESSLSHDLVRSIFQDRQGRIWVGTEEGGLNLFDPGAGIFKRYNFDKRDNRSTSHFHIKCITQDREDQIWIGTDQGVNVLNPETGVFQYFMKDDKQIGGLSSNIVRSIAEDDFGRIWLGTEGGLNMFLTKSESFIHWDESNGLSNNVVYGVLVDDRNNLWLSTNKGINRFDPTNVRFTGYQRSDGLQSDEFNTASYYKDDNGYMYFGGPNGFNKFHPDELVNDEFVPSVVFTDFLLFNKSVSIEEGGILSQALNRTESITLQYDDDIFALEFAALDFEQPERIQYAYKLEPFHKDWIYTNFTDRKASFTRIPPGEYKLYVKASSVNGQWNDVSKSIEIIVIPPWYQTLMARIIFIAVGLLIIVLVFKVRERNARVIRLQLQSMVTEKTKELKSEKEEVSKQLKEKEILMREVHHRVKNNLTFLKSLLYLRAKASTDMDVRTILDECQARIETMAIVHQVLYDRDVSSVDITSFLNELFVQLQAIFRQENVEIDLNVDIAVMHVDVNRSITVGLIINELITNSFKYAFDPSEIGKITIQVTEDDAGFLLIYSDSGPGMPVNYDFENSKGFGFRLISILINQINAEFAYSKPENSFQFSIPK